MLTFLWALVPSAGALFLFWVALRAIFQADRRERAAIAGFQVEQSAQRARGASRVPSSAGDTSDAGGSADAADAVSGDDAADAPSRDAERTEPPQG